MSAQFRNVANVLEENGKYGSYAENNEKIKVANEFSKFQEDENSKNKKTTENEKLVIPKRTVDEHRTKSKSADKRKRTKVQWENAPSSSGKKVDDRERISEMVEESEYDESESGSIGQSGTEEATNVTSRFQFEKRTFSCFHCSEKFHRTSELFQHTCNGKKEKGFVCEVCAKAFTSRSSFINHKIIHSKKKPYKCSVCGKMCSQQSNHLYHMSKKHSDVKPFSCQFLPCNESFGSRMEQKHHHVLHRKIVCKRCDKSFADRSSLEKHKKCIIYRA